MSKPVEHPQKVGETRVIYDGNDLMCKHEHGSVERSEEHSMLRPMNHYRLVEIFQCAKCGYLARKYLSDWETEGSRFLPW